jgi:hypothetical protein
MAYCDLSKTREAFVNCQQKVITLLPIAKPIHFGTPESMLEACKQLEFIDRTQS